MDLGRSRDSCALQERPRRRRAPAPTCSMSRRCTEGTPTVDVGGACTAAAAYIQQTGDDLVACTPSAVDGAQLTVTVSAEVPTVFLGLFGVNSFTMTASATAAAIEGT